MIGILGGGQLGRMLALAGYPLGLSFRFLDPSPEACAGQVGELVVGEFLDEGALLRFAEGLALVTYEFENVPVEAARRLEGRLPLYPPAKALEGAQDRLREKTFFQGLGVPTPPFHPVDGPEDLEEEDPFALEEPVGMGQGLRQDHQGLPVLPLHEEDPHSPPPKAGPAPCQRRW